MTPSSYAVGDSAGKPARPVFSVRNRRASCGAFWPSLPLVAPIAAGVERQVLREESRPRLLHCDQHRLDAGEAEHSTDFVTEFGLPVLRCSHARSSNRRSRPT